jgi:hypothetical protein
VANDPKDDLSALRIEREPMRLQRRSWAKWLVLLVFVSVIGGAAWLWAARERPVTVEVATVSQRAAGIQA